MKLRCYFYLPVEHASTVGGMEPAGKFTLLNCFRKSEIQLNQGAGIRFSRDGEFLEVPIMFRN